MSPLIRRYRRQTHLELAPCPPPHGLSDYQFAMHIGGLAFEYKLDPQRDAVDILAFCLSGRLNLVAWTQPSQDFAACTWTGAYSSV